MNRHTPNRPRSMSLTSGRAAVGTVADSATHRLQLDSGIQLLRSSPRMTVRRHAHQYESVPTSESGLNTIQPIIRLSALPVAQGRTRYDHIAEQGYPHCASHGAEHFVGVRAQIHAAARPGALFNRPSICRVRRDIDVRNAGRCTERKFTSSG